MDIREGLENGHDGQFAKGVTNIVGSTIGLGAALFGGPILGTAIGLLTFVVGGLVSEVQDDQHEISDLLIDDENFKLPEYKPKEE